MTTGEIKNKLKNFIIPEIEQQSQINIPEKNKNYYFLLTGEEAERAVSFQNMSSVRVYRYV